MAADLKEDIVSLQLDQEQGFETIYSTYFASTVFLLGLTTSHKNHEIHFKTGRWGCLYAGGGL